MLGSTIVRIKFDRIVILIYVHIDQCEHVTVFIFAFNNSVLIINVTQIYGKYTCTYYFE